MKYNIKEDDLRKMYVDDLMHVADIASYYGCSTHNIKRILKKFAIKRGSDFMKSGASPVWNRGKTKHTDKRLEAISKMHQGEGNPMSGREAWNNGLTKHTDKRLQSVSDKLSNVSKSPKHREKLSEAKTGKFADQSNNWQGGKSYQNHHLYLMNRFTRDGQRWYEHRWVSWKYIIKERDFLDDEEVHHIDRDRTNNDPQNLMVLAASDHNALHQAIAEGHSSKKAQIEWLMRNEIKFEVYNGEN